MNETSNTQNENQQGNALANYIREETDLFRNFLNTRPFQPMELIEFAKNNMYVDYEKNPQIQKHMKAFFETLAPKIKASYNGDIEKTESFYNQLFKRFPNVHVKSWEEYTNSVINFDDSKDYKSQLFGRRFPAGTISYIGARPGRGKTTTLVNIGLDALHQGKPVVFVTAEETTKQILTRFILSETYANHETDKRTVYESFKPRSFLYNFLKDSANNLPGIDIANADFYGDSTQQIKKYIDSRKLTVFEAYGASWEEMKDFLTSQESGSLILIDYIQHLKSPEHLLTAQRYNQIQDMSHQLADLAGVYNLIMISGAQFNREAKGNGSGSPDLLKPDSFDETSFREAGDIEQDGHILIGIGKTPATNELWYSCMKDREASPDDGKCWKLKKNMAFSYLRGDTDDQGQPIPYAKPGKEKENQETTSKKPTENEKLNAMKAFKYGDNK